MINVKERKLKKSDYISDLKFFTNQFPTALTFENTLNDKLNKALYELKNKEAISISEHIKKLLLSE